MVVFFQQEVASRNKFLPPPVVLGEGQDSQRANVQRKLGLRKHIENVMICTFNMNTYKTQTLKKIFEKILSAKPVFTCIRMMKHY